MTITLTNSEKVYKFENLKGADGITPQLIIEDDKWKVSYDNGVTYTELGDAKGSDGITPTITDDGYWKFGDNKTSFKAVAVDGQNGITPQLKIENDKWYVSYDNGASFVELGTAKGDKGDQGPKGDKGDNGTSPTIKNGYWYIGDENTNVKAQGTDGQNGTNGENGITPILKIENNYWFVSYDNGNNYTSLNTKAVGEDGQKGDKGITPLLKIGEDNYWYVSYDNGENYSSLNVKATGANGTNGSNGQNGADGTTPILKIGDDNYWYVSYDKGNSYSSLNVKATGNAGQNGNNGATPEIKDGYWYINNQSTGVKALGVDGNDGKTPYIKNGTWWIGDENTEVVVTGHNGANGENGKTPEIGANNNWWIDGVDTGKKAVAQDGANGQNGADGDGIVGITVNENNYLIIDMKYGEDIVIEKSIVGAAGKDGKDGNGIKSISLTANYELVIETDNGTINLGSIRGPQGPQGIAGANGLTPILSLDENGNLSVKYGEEGTLTLLGNIKGPKGDKGDNGKSAFELYKIAHPEYAGSEAEWLASLNGRGIVKTEISGTNLIIYYTDNTTETHDLSSLVGGNNSQEYPQLSFVTLPDGTYGVRANDKININDLVSVKIPTTYNGVAVTQIMAEGFKNAISLENISLPAGLKTINAYAFNGCTALTEIVIPDAVTTIKQYAFYNSGLKSISLTTAKEWTVSNVYCTQGFSSELVTLTNNGTTTLAGDYFTADISTPEKIASVFTTRRGAFNSYYYYDVYKGEWNRTPDADEPIIEETVNGKSAYELYCEAHPEYTGTLEEWLASLKGESGRGIEKAEIINGVLKITFTDGTYTTTEIEDNTIRNEISPLIFEELEDGTYEVSLNDVFENSVTSVSIPAQFNGKAVTSIASGAFYKAKYLSEVYIPNSIKNIGSAAFRECTSLKSIHIPNSVTKIGWDILKDSGVTVNNITIEDFGEVWRSTETSTNSNYFKVYKIENGAYVLSGENSIKVTDSYLYIDSANQFKSNLLGYYCFMQIDNGQGIYPNNNKYLDYRASIHVFEKIR